MKPELLLSVLFIFSLITCDPAHSGYFENGTNEPIILEIPDYLYKIKLGTKVSPYPEMKDIEVSEANISIKTYDGNKYLSVILESKESLLISMGLGPRPSQRRDLNYMIIVENDTIHITEKEIFGHMKKRDRSRFKYFYTFNEK